MNFDLDFFNLDYRHLVLAVLHFLEVGEYHLDYMLDSILSHTQLGRLLFLLVMLLLLDDLLLDLAAKARNDEHDEATERPKEDYNKPVLFF